MDGLLTTRLDSDAIFGAKWLGSILCVRWGWLWLGLIWLVGFAAGGLHPVAVAVLIAYWLALAAQFAAIGLYCSIVCRTTLRATVATVLTALFLGGGHWLMMGMCLFLPAVASRALTAQSVSAIIEFQTYGLTPPVSFAQLAFQGNESRLAGSEGARLTTFAVIGVAVWGVSAALVYFRASRRFRAVTQRCPSSQSPLPLPDPLPRREAVVVIAESWNKES